VKGDARKSSRAKRLQVSKLSADSPMMPAGKQSRQLTRMHFAQRHQTIRRLIMLYTVAVVLLILWALGLATSFTAGGLLHILLVVAVVMVIFQLVSGRRV